MPLQVEKLILQVMTGSKFAKEFTSHDLRRTVATRLAEVLGTDGDRLVKRALGHADGTVTAVYNRYGYVREMRGALERRANGLTAGVDRTPVQVIDFENARRAKVAIPRSET